MLILDIIYKINILLGIAVYYVYCEYLREKYLFENFWPYLPVYFLWRNPSTFDVYIQMV